MAIQLAPQPITTTTAQPLSAMEELLVVLAAGRVCDLVYANADGARLLPGGDRDALRGASPDELFAAHRARVVPLPGGPVAALDGATLLLPVADAGEHLLAAIWALVERGGAVLDDVSGRRIRGIEHYADLLDLGAPTPLTLLEQGAHARAASRLTTAVHAAASTAEALGLQAVEDADGRADELASPAEAARPGTAAPRADLELATRALVERAGAARGDRRTVERRIKATALIARHVQATQGRFPATVAPVQRGRALLVRRPRASGLAHAAAA